MLWEKLFAFIAYVMRWFLSVHRLPINLSEPEGYLYDYWVTFPGSSPGTRLQRECQSLTEVTDGSSARLIIWHSKDNV